MTATEEVLAGRPEVVAARHEARAARLALDEELERLEASARAAVDVRGKIRRNPVRTAGVVAGAGFLLVGGPAKVLRRTRHAIFGKPDPLPTSMLPEEIDKALRAMGDDGARVRGVIERDFAAYLKKEQRGRLGTLRSWNFVGLRAVLAGQILRALREQVLPRVWDSLSRPDPGAYERQLDRVRGRSTGRVVGEVGVEPTRPSRDTGS